jgi:tyrosyl-tRNA synthetase
MIASSRENPLHGANNRTSKSAAWMTRERLLGWSASLRRGLVAQPSVKTHRTEIPIMANKERIDEILSRGIIKQVLPSESAFRERMLAGPMRFYIGADPTSNALHLSHAKNYQLLEEFRQLGHEVIVLFGDFTALVGDPTDRTTTRSGLTVEQVRRNVDDWINQITPLMDFKAVSNPPRVLFNSEWLSALSFEQVLALAANTTVQRMLERDMFERRMEEQKPIYLHEFFYPLMQGYDSVAMDVDVELCGTDQIFNALMGRTLQRVYNQKDKFVVAVNLMENPATGTLMSKSRGNGVFLDASPFDMYGSIMAQPDEMTEVILLNNTRLSHEEMAKVLARGPRDAKMTTARLVTGLFHGVEQAAAAEQKFVEIVQKKKIPDDMAEVRVAERTMTAFQIIKMCVAEEISNREIGRLFAQGAIRLGGEVVEDRETIASIPEGGLKVNVGKRRWYNVVGP